MLYPFMTLDDNMQIVHSEILPDGQVRVCVEQPVPRGFNSATCMLPSYSWTEVEGFEKPAIDRLQAIIADSAHLIIRLAATGGFLNADGDGSDMSNVPHGEPYAGKLHVQFDEGCPPKTGEAVLREAEGRADVPCGGVSLCSIPHETTMRPRPHETTDWAHRVRA